MNPTGLFTVALRRLSNARPLAVNLHEAASSDTVSLSLSLFHSQQKLHLLVSTPHPHNDLFVGGCLQRNRDK